MSFYNYVRDYKLIDQGTVVEPVTLAEAKNYCRVSTDADNDLITDLITQARQAIEKATGLCIIKKSVQVWFDNPAGDISLPWGPMDPTSFSLYNQDNTEITASNYRLLGGQYPSLYQPTYTMMYACSRAQLLNLPSRVAGATTAANCTLCSAGTYSSMQGAH